MRATGDRWFVRRVVREVIEQDPSLEPLRGWLFGELERGNPRDLHDAGVALSRFDGSRLVSTNRHPSGRDRHRAGPAGAARRVSSRWPKCSEHRSTRSLPITMCRWCVLRSSSTHCARRSTAVDAELSRGRARSHVTDDAEGGSPRSRRRVRLVIGAIGLLALVLVGGGGVPRAETATTGRPVRRPRPRPRCPCSPPLRSPASRPTNPIRPALMVKIDNVDAARPQDGLFAADVIFEELVEGGLTRLGAVYSSNDPGLVGPIRSVRETDLHLAPLARTARRSRSRVARFPYSPSVRDGGASRRARPDLARCGRRDLLPPRRQGRPARSVRTGRVAFGTPANGAASARRLVRVRSGGRGAARVGCSRCGFPTTDVRYRWQPEHQDLGAVAERHRIRSTRRDPTSPSGSTTWSYCTSPTGHPRRTSCRRRRRSMVGTVGCTAMVASAGVGGRSPRRRHLESQLRTAQGEVCRLAPGRTVVELAPSPPVSG